MSTFTVEVSKIDAVDPHPDPETTRLSVLTIGGYQTVTAKVKGSDGEYHCPYESGDVVIYVPPDAMIPEDVAEHWGVSNYLGKHGRVKTVRIRGFVSRGFAVGVSEVGPELFADTRLAMMGPEPITQTMPVWSVGDDVAEHFGITKYEPPPPPVMQAHQTTEHPYFHRYTGIERIQRFPDVLEDGEQVVVTEKIHGTNSRVGWVRGSDGDLMMVCGTHRTQLKPGAWNMYEYPLELDSVRQLLSAAEALYASCTPARSIILFGEIYGPSVQKEMAYGLSASSLGYAAFDFAVDGEYLPWEDFLDMCAEHGVPTVPVLYDGPYYKGLDDQISDGVTTIGPRCHVREGIVIKPKVERTHWKLGRVILKRIGDSYEVGQYSMSDSH